MAPLRLTELWRYPVKSLRGTPCTGLTVAARGPLADRQWMLVDPQGVFVTQRQLPRMALIDVQLHGDGLLLRCGERWLAVSRPPTDAPLVEVSVWGDRCLAQAAHPETELWIGELLGRPCRLVYLPDTQMRAVNPKYARPDDQVGFADGFPFLLISQASLDDLNRRLAQPVPMGRFRPNLVVDGCDAYAEDNWRRIRVGEVAFRVVKPCSRCAIPTIDPQTAERGVEPLRTLMAYRRRDSKVYFGQNLIHDGLGELTEGMPVEVLE